MSKLDELIKEYCPDWVEYKKLQDVAIIDIGEFVRSDKQGDEKPFPVFNGGKGNTGMYDDYNHDGDYILVSARGANAGFVNSICGKYWAGNSCYSIAVNNVYLDFRYAYHYIKNSENILLGIQQKGSIPAVSKKQLSELVIAVPPLEVQREIVRVLDKFTLLTAELTAELTARKKQYEYYRNDLLSFETKVDRIPLGDLFDFRNGLSKGKDFFGRGIPFIRYTDVYNNRFLRKGDITALVDCTAEEIKKLNVKRGDVLFTRTSETAEDVGWSSVMLDDLDECVFNGFTIKATPKTDRLLPEYCSYCFSTDEFRKYVTKNCAFTTRASLTGETLSKYKLAVPSLEVQKKIAEVLDNFEAICSNLNIGLPAEIDARQKQYEFYRDQLLTFVEKGETILTDRQTDRQSLIKLLQHVFGYVDIELSEITKVFRGEYITQKESTLGNIPVILGGQEPAYYIDRFNHTGEVVVIARSGASAGFVSYWDEPIFITDGFGYEANIDLVLPQYLYYSLKSKEKKLNSMKRGAGVPHVSGEMLNQVKISIPSISIQKRIVEVLNHFEKISNSMDTGLPAEIEARQKQYEYYRDKLLTFKEKGV